MPDLEDVGADKIIVGIFVFLLLVVPATGIAASLSDEMNEDNTVSRSEVLESGENMTTVTVFYTEDCKYCQKTLDYVSDEVDQNSNVTMKSYEVGNNETNKKLYHKSIKSSHTGVPAVQVGNETWFGYTEDLEKDVRDKIAECNSAGCGIPDVHNRE